MQASSERVKPATSRSFCLREVDSRIPGCRSMFLGKSNVMMSGDGLRAAQTTGLAVAFLKFIHPVGLRG